MNNEITGIFTGGPTGLGTAPSGPSYGSYCVGNNSAIYVKVGYNTDIKFVYDKDDPEIHSVMNTLDALLNGPAPVDDVKKLWSFILNLYRPELGNLSKNGTLQGNFSFKNYYVIFSIIEDKAKRVITTMEIYRYSDITKTSVIRYTNTSDHIPSTNIVKSIMKMVNDLLNEDKKKGNNIMKNKQNKFEELGITHVYENAAKKTVAVTWVDGTSTSSKCSEEDEYDFAVGLALCIAKHQFKNYHQFASNLKSRKKYYTAYQPKKKKQPKKTAAKSTKKEDK